MGLLTDPNSGRGSIGKLLSKWYIPICFTMWFSGIAWFAILAHAPFNNERYFSENALLPGLVQSETTEEIATLSKTLLSELTVQSSQFSENIPSSFLLAKMQALGLEAYEHNFTLKYPLGQEKVYEGKNVYGILRASRAASTESIVFSSPYRNAKSYHDTTLPGIAVMLSFAHFARKQKYWAKDLIFLITEHEMLGVQAWLEAYHGVSEETNNPIGQGRALRSGKLKIRAGSIQAAINLELHDLKLDHIDIKLEGLNGQLPNLDLINLCHRMCTKEEIKNTFKHKLPMGNVKQHKNSFSIDHWWHGFTTVMSMVLTQVTGMPSGNHGLFHRFGIEAVTLEGISRDEPGAIFLNHNPSTPIKLVRLLEDLSRSLNNLLERFHQSFFFYLLPSSDRYISIGQYMPVLGLIAGALFIKAFALWLNIFQTPAENESNVNPNQNIEFKLMSIGGRVLLAHIIGILLMNMSVNISKIGAIYFSLSTDSSLFYGYAFFSIILLWAPSLLNHFTQNLVYDRDILNIIALLELATLLLAIGMNNFSMALLIGLIYVPFAVLINPSRTRKLNAFKYIWLLLQPLLLFSLFIIITSIIYFPEEEVSSILKRGLVAIKASITYGVVDSIVYGNWTFNMVMAFLLPNWMLFWHVFNMKNSVIKDKIE